MYNNIVGKFPNHTRRHRGTTTRHNQLDGRRVRVRVCPYLTVLYISSSATLALCVVVWSIFLGLLLLLLLLCRPRHAGTCPFSVRTHSRRTQTPSSNTPSSSHQQSALLSVVSGEPQDISHSLSIFASLSLSLLLYPTDRPASVLFCNRRAIGGLLWEAKKASLVE